MNKAIDNWWSSVWTMPCAVMNHEVVSSLIQAPPERGRRATRGRFLEHRSCPLFWGPVGGPTRRRREDVDVVGIRERVVRADRLGDIAQADNGHQGVIHLRLLCTTADV